MLSNEDGKERELLGIKEGFLDTNDENKAGNKSDSYTDQERETRPYSKEAARSRPIMVSPCSH